MISIDWATKVINIPKADLTSLGGGLYELDINDFRLTLKNLEDDEAGITFPRTHNHNTIVSVAGVTLARVVEIINGYTITFEDGQYAVNLVGANSNISDVTNVNQVSIRSFNTAGLIVSGGSSGGLTSEQENKIDRILGLSKENMVVDNQVYDYQNRITSSRIRTYDTKDNALVGGVTGMIAQYTMSAVYLGKQLIKYTVVRDQ